ncbi:MAG: ribonuclease HII [Nitrospirae bacterium]|nr:ribonuclease HII [Nitrospirota bacterium]
MVRSIPPGTDQEEILWRQGCRSVAGVDEAGRGPLAGPVVAAAVILSPGTELPGVRDSKTLSPATRERLFDKIRGSALGVGIGTVDAPTIDRINVLEATRLAMAEAVRNLPIPPEHLLTDAVRLPNVPIPQTPFIRGDALVLSIAAASVIAKVTRDRLMGDYHRLYPEYAFDRHKGYGTSEHLAALRRFGPSPIHRRTFRGVLIPAADAAPDERRGAR